MTSLRIPFLKIIALLALVASFTFQQKLQAQTANPFLSQFVFKNATVTMEVSDASGNSSQILLYTGEESATRDSFTVIGYNMSVFTQEFQAKLLNMFNVTNPTDIELEAASDQAMNQFMLFYNSKASAGSTSPVAVTVFANEIVPTISKVSFFNYRKSLRTAYLSKKKALKSEVACDSSATYKMICKVRGFDKKFEELKVKSNTLFLGDPKYTGKPDKLVAARDSAYHFDSTVFVARKGKLASMPLTSRECHQYVSENKGMNPGCGKRKYSGLEAYLKSISEKKAGMQGYLLVDSISMEVLDGSIRNLAVMGTQYLIPANAAGAPISKVEILNDSTVLLNGAKRLHTQEKGNQFLNNFGGDSLIVQHPVVFRSQFPIPISSMNNFGEINSVLLVQMAEPNSIWVLPLGLVMKMVPELGLNSDDYSPEDKIYHIRPRGAECTEPAAILHKENTKDLFVAKVYTDFVGVQSDAPNGLIQTEVSKKIIINPQNLTGTFANFFEPRFTWSKIENKEKYIPSFIALSDTELAYTSSLQIYRYSKFNFGGRMNLVRFDIPAIKMSLFANSGAYIYQTSFSDTLSTSDSIGTITNSVNQFNGTSFSWENEIEVMFHPDPRYGMGVSATYRYMKLLSDKFQPENKNLLGFQLTGYFRPVPAVKNTMYFRAGIQLQANDFNENFVQLQVGYSFNLTKE